MSKQLKEEALLSSELQIFEFPTGRRAEVEVVENMVYGFTYYDITNGVMRTYTNVWRTWLTEDEEEAKA